MSTVGATDKDTSMARKTVPSRAREEKFAKTISEAMNCIRKSEKLKLQKCEEAFAFVKSSLGKQIVEQSGYRLYI